MRVLALRMAQETNAGVGLFGRMIPKREYPQARFL